MEIEGVASENKKGNGMMKVYLDTNIVSYIIKRSYPEKIGLIEELIKTGRIEPVTSYTTEDETEEARTVRRKIRVLHKERKMFIDITPLISVKIIQAPIAVWGFAKFGRDLFTNKRAGNLYDEFFGEIQKSPNEARPNAIRDALHYVNILYWGVDLVISGDNNFIRILNRRHPEIRTLYFHDPNFSKDLQEIVTE